LREVGKLYDANGEYDRALACFDRAVEFKPDLPEAWYIRGNALFNLGRYEEAIASYDKAVAIKPDYHQAWYNRGVALGNLGRLEEAIASYDQAVAIKNLKSADVEFCSAILSNQ
jgi:tetratricopeptide (TPR) repeat protein